mmetsp:Transcript_18024/g.35354  ORF Transcript_18024/g.35354 Transcript_18024/m.35354 type:complete len:251 (+) Transcript_18024:1595-2347(+)
MAPYRRREERQGVLSVVPLQWFLVSTTPENYSANMRKTCGRHSKHLQQQHASNKRQEETRPYASAVGPSTLELLCGVQSVAPQQSYWAQTIFKMCSDCARHSKNRSLRPPKLPFASSRRLAATRPSAFMTSRCRVTKQCKWLQEGLSVERRPSFLAQMIQRSFSINSRRRSRQQWRLQMQRHVFHTRRVAHPVSSWGVAVFQRLSTAFASLQAVPRHSSWEVTIRTMWSQETRRQIHLQQRLVLNKSNAA